MTAVIDSALHAFPNCDEFGEGLIRFKNGVVATLAAGWVDETNPIDMTIWGTEGHAYVTRDDRLFFKSPHVPGAEGKQPWTLLPDNLQSNFYSFLDKVLGKGFPEIISVRQAAYVSSVMEAFYIGAKEQKWVKPICPFDK